MPQQPIDPNKPILQNPDGSISTERTITIEVDGQFFNIPTILDGIAVPDEDAVNSFFKTGRHVGQFRTLKAAETEAIGRSKAIGDLRQTPARELNKLLKGKQPASLEETLFGAPKKKTRSPLNKALLETLAGPVNRLTPLQEKVRKLKRKPPIKKLKRSPIIGASRG